MKVQQDLAHYFSLLINIMDSDESDKFIYKNKKKTHFNFKQPRILNFERRTYWAPSVNDNWQVDLIDLSKQGGGYMMNAVDVFSRRAESVKLNGKSKEDIKKGLNELYNKFGAKPNKIQSDKEKGLYALQDDLKKQGINLYTVKNSYDLKNSAPIVERFNRTMRNYRNEVHEMKPKMNAQTLTNYVVNNFTKEYNNTKHSTVKAKPLDIAQGLIKKEDVLNEAIGRNYEEKSEPKEQFKEGDKVYKVSVPPVGVERKDADKYERNPYIIEKVLKTNPITYKLRNLSQKFYKQQLKKI